MFTWMVYQLLLLPILKLLPFLVEFLELSDNSQVDCRHISQCDTTVSMKSQKEDNLLCNLQHYYDEVKTKRQLNMDVPAGFRHNTSFK
jgi:hypothetical protein